MIGFLDGTSNLKPGKDEIDERLVFVDPKNVALYPPLPASEAGPYAGQGAQFPGDLRQPPTREPEWTTQGSYMVVRGSVVDIDRWDDVALGDQEHTIGRFKVSGASLDLSDDPSRVFDPPAFATDQSNVTVPVDSHARKVDPRRPEDADRRIFRRGFPLIRAVGPSLERGLVFVAYARSISTQFEIVVRAWMRNPNFPHPGAGVDRLLAFDTRVLAGGYYFVPPIRRKDQPWSWILPPVAG